jgi:hypothetical protein
MNQMTEPSTFDGPGRPEWPLNALSRRAIEALFSKMSAFYGDKFAMMWRGSKIDEVQKAWAIELAKLSREQLKAGSESMTALPKPPTLPEFINLCRQARLEQAAIQAPRLEHVTPADQKIIDANLAKIRHFSKPKRLSAANPGWAYDFFIRGAALNAQETSVEVARSCRQAILSQVGREYPSTQEGERAQQCAEILSRVVRETLEVQ